MKRIITILLAGALGLFPSWRQRRSSLACVAFGLLASTAQAQWTVTNLTPPGSRPPDSQVLGGGDGQQVGLAVVAGRIRASLWTGTATSWVDLHPATASSSRANDASEGHQVGFANFGLFPRASLWNGTAASWIDLSPAGSSSSSASGVGGGQQVGSARVGGIFHASLWSGSSESWLSLNPAGVTSAFANDVSNGRQVGSVSLSGISRASLWSGSASSWVDLHPSGSASSVANAISGETQVGQFTANGLSYACLWTGRAASMINLHPAAALRSTSVAVFNDFQVGNITGEDGVLRASLWNGTAASWEDLSSSLDEFWNQSSAESVWSDSSTLYVAGSAIDAVTGAPSAFLWTRPIPSPSAAALLGVSSAFWLCRRRRGVSGRCVDRTDLCDRSVSRCVRTAVLGSVLLAGPAIGQPTFSVIDRVPGVGSQTTALAISRDGSRVKGQVGRRDSMGGVDGNDFTWTRTGGLQLITAPDGASLAWGSGASISGDGRSYGADFDYSFSGQWLLREGDAAIEVGTPGAYTNIAKISHDGSVVAGWTDSLPDGVYVWTATTGRTHLGVPGGIVTGMSSSGDALVGLGNDGTSWTWSQQSGLRTIAPLSGTTSVRLNCMNAEGTIAYGYSDTPSGDRRAVSLIDGVLEDALFSGLPIQLNSDGTVLLTSYTVNGMTRTGLLDGPGNFTDLHEFFADSGLLPAGFQMFNFRDMSGDAMTFVGDGRDVYGNTRGFVATIPSPSALTLLLGSTLLGIRRRRRVGMICAAASTLALVCQASAQPTEYRIERAGLFDAEHSSVEGIRYSELSLSATGGAVFGTSFRFLGQNAFIPDFPGLFPRGGVSAWIYHGGASVQLGLLDGVHTSPSNVRSSNVVAVTSGGLATGTSTRFNTSGDGNGASAWSYASGVTARIGLLDAAHTSTLGQQSSRPVALNGSAVVVGTSTRYIGAVFAGTSTWTHSVGTSMRTGLFGAEYTRADGFQQSGFASTRCSLERLLGPILSEPVCALGYSVPSTQGPMAFSSRALHRLRHSGHRLVGTTSLGPANRSDGHAGTSVGGGMLGCIAKEPLLRLSWSMLSILRLQEVA